MSAPKAEPLNKPEELVGWEKEAADRYPQGPTDKAACEAVKDSTDPRELVRVAHAHWDRIGWPEEIDLRRNLEVPHMCNCPCRRRSSSPAPPIEDALAQVTASLTTLRSECIRIAASLVRMYGELGPNEREVVDRDTVVSIAMELKTASDGMHQPSRLVGSPHVRDPEFPCNEFVPGTPANGRCDGDGHYLCAQCVFHREDETGEYDGETA